VTTATQAFGVVKARIESNRPSLNGVLVLLRWQNQDEDTDGNRSLPDVPAPFAYTEFVTDPARLAGFGGGRGRNLYRNPARIDCYVFVPRGWGLEIATDIAEQFATLFRSYRDGDISCFDASVYPGGNGSDIKPPGVQSDVDNYYWAICEISLHFDQVG
jgi:hypothetical protein